MCDLLKIHLLMNTALLQ